MRAWISAGMCGLVVAMACATGGCAAAGVAGDVASTSVSAAKEVFTAGKAEMFVPVPWEQAVEGVQHASERLTLTTVREQGHPEQRKLVFKDDRGQQITVTVVRRSEAISELRVDVGLFGPESEGRMMLRELVKELPVADEDKKRAGEE